MFDFNKEERADCKRALSRFSMMLMSDLAKINQDVIERFMESTQADRKHMAKLVEVAGRLEFGPFSQVVSFKLAGCKRIGVVPQFTVMTFLDDELYYDVNYELNIVEMTRLKALDFIQPGRSERISQGYQCNFRRPDDERDGYGGPRRPVILSAAEVKHNEVSACGIKILNESEIFLQEAKRLATTWCNREELEMGRFVQL